MSAKTVEFDWIAETVRIPALLTTYKTVVAKSSLDLGNDVDWNTYKMAGVYQTGAVSWGTSLNKPHPVMSPVGTLAIFVSGDTLIQLYVDVVGNMCYRTLYGLSSTTWSQWSYKLVPATVTVIPTSSDVPFNSERIFINTGNWIRRYFNNNGTVYYLQYTQ